MGDRLDELDSVEFIVIVRIVHFEVVKLQLLIGHLRLVNVDLVRQVLLDVPRTYQSINQSVN